LAISPKTLLLGEFFCAGIGEEGEPALNGNIRGRPDFLLLFSTVLLVSVGMVMVFSASSPFGCRQILHSLALRCQAGNFRAGWPFYYVPVYVHKVFGLGKNGFLSSDYFIASAFVICRL